MLYGAVYNGKILLGGGRIELPADYTDADTDPQNFKERAAATKDYFDKLMTLPEGAAFERSWTGVMCCPTDEDFPLVGPVEQRSELFLCTGFGPAGFRQGYAAGAWLARVMEEGVEWMDKETDAGLKQYKTIMPSDRVKLSAGKAGGSSAKVHPT